MARIGALPRAGMVPTHNPQVVGSSPTLATWCGSEDRGLREASRPLESAVVCSPGSLAQPNPLPVPADTSQSARPLQHRSVELQLLATRADRCGALQALESDRRPGTLPGDNYIAPATTTTRPHPE